MSEQPTATIPTPENTITIPSAPPGPPKVPYQDEYAAWVQSRKHIGDVFLSEQMFYEAFVSGIETGKGLPR